MSCQFCLVDGDRSFDSNSWSCGCVGRLTSMSVRKSSTVCLLGHGVLVASAWVDVSFALCCSPVVVVAEIVRRLIVVGTVSTFFVRMSVVRTLSLGCSIRCVMMG